MPVLPKVVLVGFLLLPAAQACSVGFEDGAGDQDGPDGPLDLLAVQVMAGADALTWRVRAADLEEDSSGVQYGGYLVPPGEDLVAYQPYCALRAPFGTGVDCTLSRSETAGEGDPTASYRHVAVLEGRVVDGWVEAQIAYELMGLALGDIVRDLRATSQLLVYAPQNTTFTPVVTDRAGEPGVELILCAPAGDEGGDNTTAGPDAVPVGGGRSTPGVPLAALAVFLAAAAVLRRR